MDISGDDYTSTIKYGTGLWSFNMMQSIGRKLCMGFDMMNIIERKMIIFSYGLKYKE